MTAAYASRDGWRVSVIRTGERELLRVEYARPRLPDGTVPAHSDGTHRAGTVRTAHGCWVGDFSAVSDVAALVPLSELEPLT